MGARKRRHQEEHVNHERWLVSYADFITLLFAFFTVLYATSQQDVEKAKQFEDSIRKSFGAILAGGATGGEAPVYERSRNFIEAPIQTFPDPRKANLEVEEFVDRYLKKSLSEAEYKAVVAEVYSDTDGVRIRLSAQALFTEGSSVISSKVLGALDKIGQMLKQTSRSVIIEGHTDSKLVEKSAYPSNWELSSMRATKIVRYFIERSGVSAEQLSTRAYADQRPINDGTSQDGRTTNERIEILISSQAREE